MSLVVLLFICSEAFPESSAAVNVTSAAAGEVSGDSVQFFEEGELFDDEEEEEEDDDDHVLSLRSEEMRRVLKKRRKIPQSGSLSENFQKIDSLSR